MLLEVAIVSGGIAAVVYIVRKIQEYRWGWVRNTSSLKGKIFIVTGANTGLGFETTKALVKRGATVIMACRNLERVKNAILKIGKTDGEMIPLKLDLADFESIKAFVSIIKSKYSNFDCLINNAGLSTLEKEFTKQNFEVHMGVNHLGHFLLTNLLIDNIRENNSRIVIVSSLLHQQGTIDFNYLGKWKDEFANNAMNGHYKNSKLANFYFARELYKKGFDCHVLCPGLCHTDFFRNYNPRWYHYIIFAPVVWLALRSAKQGAQNIIHCATDNVNTTDKNPLTGYFVRNMVQTKSKHNFDDNVSAKLWDVSLEMCSLK